MQRVERYVSVAKTPSQSQVWNSALDKLMSLELKQLEEQYKRLEKELRDFEERYGMPSEEFYAKFEQGKLGDEMDFIEWSATFEMVQNLRKKMAILKGER